jgi:hypothetical protein
MTAFWVVAAPPNRKMFKRFEHLSAWLPVSLAPSPNGEQQTHNDRHALEPHEADSKTEAPLYLGYFFSSWNKYIHR